MAEGPKYVVRIGELTIAQQDHATKLMATGKAGRVSALVYVALKAEHPGMTLDHVKSLKQSEVLIIKDGAGELDSDDDDDGDGDGEDPTSPVS
jgi:hypothetical protein